MIKDRIWTLVSRKLSGEALASELTELNDLIKVQANADLYLHAIEEYWNIPSETDEEFLEATYHIHLNRLRERGFDLESDRDREEATALYFDYEAESPKRLQFKKIILTTSLVAAFALVYFILFNVENAAKKATSNKIAQSEVSTKSGSRTKIQLPDGSSVWLNGSSKLVYDNTNFGETIREVTLTGEGYFDVVKNKEKPFIIHANKINIKVLGTAFNVKAYPGEKNTETSLVRGSIEVTMKDRKDKIMMKPNDKLIIPNEVNDLSNLGTLIKKNKSATIEEPVISMRHLTLAKDESTIIETAWVDNKLVFDHETFEEVALKMEKWYGVTINFADEQLKLQPLTGTFEKETVTEALDALQLSRTIFKYKINNQTISIFK
jgi:ferric-dicitrate binding protein FerR (iron transport regulator)